MGNHIWLISGTKLELDSFKANTLLPALSIQFAHALNILVWSWWHSANYVYLNTI